MSKIEYIQMIDELQKEVSDLKKSKK